MEGACLYNAGPRSGAGNIGLEPTVHNGIGCNFSYPRATPGIFKVPAAGR